MFYFAYGSNLDPVSMRSRCPAARSIGPATLDGYEFFIGDEGWASVRKQRGRRVHGLLWKLTPRDLAALHNYEMLHAGLYRLVTVSVQRGARRKAAITYVLRRRGIGRPRPGYIDLIVGAARQWGLPEAYVVTLARWSRVGVARARKIGKGEIA